MRKHFNYSTDPRFSELLCCHARCFSPAHIESGEGLWGELNHRLHSQPGIAPQPIPAPGRTREGFGGEKAARKSASLPVPTIPQTTNQPIIAAQQSFRSASSEAALFPRVGRPQPSPTPTRTRHRHLAGRRGCGGRRTRPQLPTTLQRSPTRHLAGRRGCGGRRIRPQLPTTR